MNQLKKKKRKLFREKGNNTRRKSGTLGMKEEQQKW